MTTTFTRYTASIDIPGHTFPLEGPLTLDQCVMLAAGGNTVREPSPELVERATDLLTRLREGRVVQVARAVVTPRE
jgi:hypothetical protein